MNYMDELAERLEHLVKLHGVSGHEDEVKEHIKSELSGFKTYEDNMGNLIATLGNDAGSKKSIAIVAHMDELGFVVSNIDERGFIKFRKLGGIDDRTLPGKPVVIKTKNGKYINGVIGIKPPHLIIDDEEKKKVLTWDKMCIDSGARSKEELQDMGIHILDSAVIRKEFVRLRNDIVSARGLDNRAGCLALLELFTKVKNEPLQNLTIHFIWSVQEEIGLRGATIISNTMRPDYVFAVDTCSSTDFPDIEEHHTPVQLGNGPILRMIDRRSIASPFLRKLMLSITEEKKIPVQEVVTGGSTDGAALQESGAAVMPVCIPLRYTHSPVECVDLTDIENAVELLYHTIRKLNEG